MSRSANLSRNWGSSQLAEPRDCSSTVRCLQESVPLLGNQSFSPRSGSPPNSETLSSRIGAFPQRIGILLLCLHVLGKSYFHIQPITFAARVPEWHAAGTVSP